MTMRVLGAIALLMVVSAAHSINAQQAPTGLPSATGQAATGPDAGTPPTDNGDRIKLEGFRSAQWGMTDAQVKAAIRKDFGIAPDKIKSEDNGAERTQIFTITVPDLLEGAGSGRVSYIFGYTSKKLIQVNILWGTPVDPQIPAEKIVTAANQLRQLFLDSGYQPESIATNAKLADGTIVVFQGQDADKRTTILRLASAPATARGPHGEHAVPTAALSLSYVLDSRNPDIYRLKKGQF